MQIAKKVCKHSVSKKDTPFGGANKSIAKVAEEAYQENTASTYPEPEDKEAFIRTHLYDYNYDKVISHDLMC